MDLEFKPGDIVLGKLRVERLLGAGGLGAVYEVHHTLTHHRRALKLLHPRFRDDTNVITRFIREASAAGRIGNPHIVDAFDAGTLETGAPYLLMEMLEGEPLAERLRREGRLSIAETALLMSQTCDAIGAAHAAGIVHRDLKPDNLFVTTREGRPFIKVLDFGISKFDALITGAQQVTQDNTAMGTPLYMAPEQMRGAKDVDARADVYSLGVILYECLAGGTPYYGESFAELAAQVLAGNARRVDTLRDDLPAELSNLVHACMQLLPVNRPATAREVGAQLTPFIGSGVFIAPPPVKKAFTDTMATPMGTADDSGLDRTSAPSSPARTASNDTLAAVTKPAPGPTPDTPPVVATEPRAMVTPMPATGPGPAAAEPPPLASPAAPRSRTKRIAIAVVLAVALPKLVHSVLSTRERISERRAPPTLQAFSQLEVREGMTVVVKKGASALSEGLDQARFEQTEGALTLRPASGASGTVTLYTERLERLTVRQHATVVVELGSNGPCNVEVYSGGTVRAAGLDCASANLNLHSGTVTMAGVAKALQLAMHEGATAELLGLSTNHVGLDARSSTVRVTATEKLDGTIRATSVTYEGTPVVQLDKDEASSVTGPPPRVVEPVDAGSPDAGTPDAGRARTIKSKPGLTPAQANGLAGENEAFGPP